MPTNVTPLPTKKTPSQEVAWISARLREKSTYAGLGVIVSMMLPLLAKYVPALQDANSSQIVDYISMVGMGVGGLLSVFCREKGSAAVIAFLVAGALLVPHSANAQPRSDKLPVHHHHKIVARVPQDDPVALPEDDPRLNGLYDALAKSTASASATSVAQNILSTAPADIAYAIQLATQAGTPAANVRKQCYQAIQAAIPVNPAGATMPPGPDVVTHIEQAAELADTLNPSSPVFVNCAGAAALAGQNVLSFVNAVVTGITGIAVLAPKIP